ncbi:MAG: MOSC domain-containing protein [Neisseria sp.]|nr:MOSC domain-containing protein [Neisseria sp.]
MQLSEIVYFPVKSMRGINAESALILPAGMPHDREWLLTRPNGEFITARKFPHMLLWQAVPLSDGLKLTAPDGESRTAFIADFDQPGSVTVWDDSFEARHSSHSELDEWLSSKLDTPCRLHYLGAQSARMLDYSQTPLSFADGAPYLLANTASLEALNAKLAEPVEMRRFRANLIIDTDSAWAEEGWRRIRIGTVEFDLFKPCVRCVMTTVDLNSGQKHPTQQPLKTLAYDHKACFGVNMVALNSGTVHLHDEVTVLAAK